MNNKNNDTNIKGCIGAIIALALIASNSFLSLMGTLLAVVMLGICIYGTIRCNKRIFGILGIIFSVIALSIIPVISKHNEKLDDNSIVKESKEESEDETESSNTDKENEENDTNDTNEEEDLTNLKVGEGIDQSGLNIVLSHVKISNFVTTTLGTKESVRRKKQVLFAFFDVYNSSTDICQIDSNSFECYVDDVACKEVDTGLYFIEDGVASDYDSDVHSGCSKMVVANFEIPRKFKNVRFYFGSNCIWRVKSSEISNEKYNGQTMYTDNINYHHKKTRRGRAIYRGDYRVFYNGYKYVSDILDNKYIVFKFTINNAGNSDLDYSTVGYKMACYANNYLMSPCSITFDEKVDGYDNVFNIDEIKAGMKARVYAAFPVEKRASIYRMVYDVGYLEHDVLGNVFA